MNAEEKSFNEFIYGDVICVIPVYQRNYNWKTIHCERLFNDIKNIIENETPHFIGTFVYKKESDVGIFYKYVIIDGQQRITTVILFARALYEFAGKDLQEDINARFLRHTSGGKMKNACRLRPTEFDQGVFQKIMDGADDFTDEEKNSHMYKNFIFLRNQIAAAQIDNAPIAPQKFFDAISQLKVVSIRLDNENPQEIFESLNSTGLDLSQADLVRNFLLLSLDYERQENFYKTYWLAIENLLRPSDNIEKFIVQYLITNRKSNAISDGKRQLSNKNLYEIFKIFSKKVFNEDSEACLKDLLRYAKFFRRCTFNDNTIFADLPALDKKFYELTFLLKADNAPIILMYLLDRYEKNHFDEATFIKFVDALISLAFRAKVCKRNGIDQQFSGNVLARLDKENPLTEEIFWKAITFGNGDRAFPNNNDFSAALANTNLQDRIKSDGFKYFLYSLERQAGTQNLPLYSEIIVEQILPKSPNAAWKNYLAERGDLQSYEPWLQSLGNQILVGKKGNETFDSKKIRYGQSNFAYTRVLSGYSHWTSKQIQARAKKLAAEAIKIWTLPEKFNVKIKDDPGIFNLDSDFKAFTGEKLATLSILGKETDMPHWNWMVREIVRQLYALDPDNFKLATQMENVRRSLFTSEPTEHKIDNDFYMIGGFSVENCLKIIKTLVENFDRLAGTNLREEIWFTLKKS